MLPTHNANRVDPTRTATVRRLFTDELDRRLRAIIHDVQALIVDEDAFGLKQSNAVTGNQRWQFRTTPQQVQAFQEWLQANLRQQLLDNNTTPTADAYWRAYVEDAHRQGAALSFDDTHKPILKSLLGTEDFYNDTKQEFFRSAFGGPVSTDKVKHLAGRVFTELRGLTEDMATRLTRTLTDGLARGDGPLAIARALTADIDGISRNRAMTIARTEVVRAHAEGQLDALEQLGSTDVRLQAEWDTADDGRVCPICRPLDGVVRSIKEARGLIPAHPNCRCVWLPLID